MSLEIKNLEDLIKPSLKQGQKMLSCNYDRLLPPGENYGSVMVKVQVKVLNENGQEEIINCVGKTCPPTELIWELFNTKVTFKKEIAVYTTIVPALNEFGREKGIDCIMDFFAECLGARISLDPASDVVDKNAVLLLENLKFQGYEVLDRFVGFNMETTKLLLRDLAIMHAVPIAYRREKPDEFNSKLRPHLNKDFSFKFPPETIATFIETSEKLAGLNPNCVPYLSKIKEALLKLTSYTPENRPPERQLFATFTHNDFWVNNTMLKFENDKPVKNKMVDFQVIEYHSLAHDVIFFLYSSVELSVLKDNVDYFLKYYYDKFIETLTRFECDVRDFTFEALMEEFAEIARQEQFGHVVIMLPALMTLKETAKDLAEFNFDENNFDANVFHENYAKRLQFAVLDFAKRGWL